MNSAATSAFDLPDRLATKADPGLIGVSERHFVAIAQSLEVSIGDLSDWRFLSGKHRPSATKFRGALRQFRQVGHRPGSRS